MLIIPSRQSLNSVHLRYSFSHAIIFIYCIFQLHFLSAQDIYAPGQIQQMNLQFYHSNYHQLLDSFKRNDLSYRLPARITINQQKYDSVGVRYKGNSSFFNTIKTGSRKLPFNLDFQYYVLDKKKSSNAIHTLKIANMFRDPSFVREVLSYEIINRFIVAPRANFISVTVNQQPLGVYANTESIDKVFFQNRFQNTTGTLYKCDPKYDESQLPALCNGKQSLGLQYAGKDPSCYARNFDVEFGEGQNALIRFTQQLNDLKIKPEQYLDVHSTIWMHAFNNVFLNLDSYLGRLCHNYYLYIDTTGYATPIMWDFNLSMGGFRFLKATPLNEKELAQLDPYEGIQDPTHPLIKNLFLHPEYLRLYKGCIKTLIDSFLVSDQLLQRAKLLQSQILPEVKKELNGNAISSSMLTNLEDEQLSGKTPIPGLGQLLRARRDFLLSKPEFQSDTAFDISQKKEQDSTGLVTITLLLNQEAKVTLYLKSPNQFKPKAIPLIKATTVDSKTSYSTQFQFQTGQSYYYVIHGSIKDQFYPAFAPQEHFKL